MVNPVTAPTRPRDTRHETRQLLGQQSRCLIGRGHKQDKLTLPGVVPRFADTNQQKQTINSPAFFANREKVTAVTVTNLSRGKRTASYLKTAICPLIVCRFREAGFISCLLEANVAFLLRFLMSRLESDRMVTGASWASPIWCCSFQKCVGMREVEKRIKQRVRQT